MTEEQSNDFVTLFQDKLSRFQRYSWALRVDTEKITAYLGENEMLALRTFSEFMFFGRIDVKKDIIEFMGCDIVRVCKKNYFQFGFTDK